MLRADRAPRRNALTEAPMRLAAPGSVPVIGQAGLGRAPSAPGRSPAARFRRVSSARCLMPAHIRRHQEVGSASNLPVRHFNTIALWPARRLQKLRSREISARGEIKLAQWRPCRHSAGIDIRLGSLVSRRGSMCVMVENLPAKSAHSLPRRNRIASPPLSSSRHRR